MRTLRLCLSAAVTVALLGGLGGLALAQMDEDADAAYVTVAVQPTELDPGSVVWGDPLYTSRDGVLVHELDASDPRLSGTQTIRWNVDVDLDTQQGIMWGTSRIENAGGSWEGPFTGMEYQPAEEDFYTSSGFLVGDGDYDGYAFCYQVTGRQHSDEILEAHGVIFKGQPPVVEPPAQ